MQQNSQVEKRQPRQFRPLDFNKAFAMACCTSWQDTDWTGGLWDGLENGSQAEIRGC